MDVTVPRRIRRRGAIWGVRSGQGDRNPEEEAWAAPGQRTGSQQPKRSEWHRVARNPGDKTHNQGRLQAPRPSWQRTLNRTRPSPGADGCGDRSALNSEPARGRSRSLPHPRQTGEAGRTTKTEGSNDARAKFSGRGRNPACLAAWRTFRWKSNARLARHVAGSGGATSRLPRRICTGGRVPGALRCRGGRGAYGCPRATPRSVRASGARLSLMTVRRRSGTSSPAMCGNWVQWVQLGHRLRVVGANLGLLRGGDGRSPPRCAMTATACFPTWMRCWPPRWTRPTPGRPRRWVGRIFNYS